MSFWISLATSFLMACLKWIVSLAAAMLKRKKEVDDIEKENKEDREKNQKAETKEDREKAAEDIINHY